MPFLARLLLSLSCIVAVAIPATAANLRGMAGADEPALHCQHEGPADHGNHDGDHDAGKVLPAQGSCDDCSVCTSHCTPVMVAAPGRPTPTGSSLQASTPPPILAGVTAAPELKPPRL